MGSLKEAVTYNDNLYEKINYLLVKSSMELSKEKGHYPKFKGSDWESGHYFDQREYTSGERVGEFVTTEQWKELQAEVRQNGVRNAWLFAIAPNGSTSIIAGSTASIDPLYELLSYERKQLTKLPIRLRICPKKQALITKQRSRWTNMLPLIWRLPVSATSIRDKVSTSTFDQILKQQNSWNCICTPWRAGMKSTYYVRSRALTIEES